MSLLWTLEHLLKAGVYPRDRWYEEDDEEEEEEEDSGGGGGDDDDDDDDDDQGGGDFDFGDDSGDDDDQGDDSGGVDFDYGDEGDDSGWVAVQDYEDNGRTIRKFTDATGTDYFQDVGAWEPRSSRDANGFDWGDTPQRDDWMRGEPRELPDVDQDTRDLFDYYHPYTVSKFEDDPVRRGWNDGIASDGTRFDQQDQGTREMFGSVYGDRAAQFWAEQRSRDLEAEFRQRGLVTLPEQQQPNPVLELPRGTSLFGQEPTPAPASAPPPANALGLGAIGEVPAPTTSSAPAESPIPPYAPPAPPPPPPGQQAAADAAARSVAQAGGSPQQVADAAAAAALAYDRRDLSSESLETQRQFQQAYGEAANERWVQQHNQELMLNRALYGTEEPRAGSPQVGSIPGLGDVGPAPDRTIGRAEPAPWNRPIPASPGAAGVPAQAPAAAQPAPPSAIYNQLSPSQVSAVTGTTRGLIEGILQRPTAGEPGGPPLAPGPVLESPSPIDAAVRRAANVPPPLTAEQAAMYERGGVNPATGDIAVHTTPPPGFVEAGQSIPSQYPDMTQVPMTPPDDVPTQTMREAGFIPTSNQIDTSIRTAAGVPTPFDADLGPREATRAGPLQDPFGMLVQRAAEAQGATDVEGFGRNVAAGIAAREAWAEPYVNDLARAAWYRESRGLEGGPQNAPASYIEDWKGAFRDGDVGVPGVAIVSDEMRSRGVPTPSDLARATEVQQAVADWRSGVARLPQGLATSYSDPANVGRMAAYACGAAAFATAVNAVNPDAGLKVDTAMALLNRGGRNLINPSVGLTLGSDLSAMAPAFNDAGVDAEARNFTPETVQQHFANGGGPIVFSGPGWGRAMGVPAVPTHIYTATNADASGLTIVESSGSNFTRMTWGQWQGATGGPARGAGISAVPQSAPSPGAAPAPASPAAMTVQMQATEAGPPSPQANLKPTFTVPETEQMRNRILTEMPDIAFDPNDGVETRMAKIAPALEWLEKEYGVSAEVMAGMAYNENHLGMANSGAVRGNNLWSVQYMPSDSQATGPIPEGRWSRYPSIKHALARFVGMYAHPENSYRYTWQNRSDPDKFMQGLDKDKYVVDEPGFPKSDWYTGVNRGRALYRRVRAGQVTTLEDPAIGRGN